MATVILIGSSEEGTSSAAANYFHLIRYVALKTAAITEIRCRGTANGNVKLAIYTDTAGAPDARLGANNEGQACTANQWNTLIFPSTNITKDTYYWLAFNIDTAQTITRKSTTDAQTGKVKSATYSTFTFPDPAGTGFTAQNYWMQSIAGWGTAAGWTYISKVNGVVAASISKVNGVAVAAISKFNGVAV